MTRYKEIPVAVLMELLAYDRESGFLYWKAREPKWFDGKTQEKCNRSAKWWNGRFAGKQAFNIAGTRGYLVGSIFNVMYKTHRVIWALETGQWPKFDIDHRDMNRTNNKFSNLREATQAQNQANVGALRTNTSGYKGVFFDKRRSRWEVSLVVNRVRVLKKSFKTLEEARSAYRAATIEHNDKFARY